MVCCSILVAEHLFCGWLWASEFWFVLVLGADFGLLVVLIYAGGFACFVVCLWWLL